ncbi:GNAT family N-acetyltransferase [Wenzhouxiangella sp. EGI_FJ10305]|uniref:GNAT family N-acetyltransferase n=1 Tax=Wenzhouxiangella sp. EGI_FJ10305 TaxID=3243768 RepID=UPI0035DC18B5
MTTPFLSVRPARESDLSTIVGMLSDDPLGSERERFVDPLPSSYIAAFEAIDKDQNNELVVAEGEGAAILAVLQITFTPYITHQGGWRATIEGVRVNRNFRGSGVGRELFAWAINRAQQRGCHLVQLTTDKKRPEAIRFYESLGFAPSHEGMKLKLEVDQPNVT